MAKKREIPNKTKWGIYRFTDKYGNNAFIFAASEMMAQLKIMQGTKNTLKFTGYQGVDEMKNTKAYIIHNDIKPFGK